MKMLGKIKGNAYGNWGGGGGGAIIAKTAILILALCVIFFLLWLPTLYFIGITIDGQRKVWSVKLYASVLCSS